MSKNSIKIPTIEELLKAGVHFGHQTKRRSPFMDEFVYGVESKSQVIDLYRTQEKLKIACEYLYDVASRGEQIVLVGTKRQASEIVKKLAIDADILFINQRWLGGTFTNFSSIKGRIQKMEKLLEMKKNNQFSHYTKREKLIIDREITKLELLLGGIRSIKKFPDVLVITDIKKERVAVAEANSVNVPIVAMVDTNTDPRNIAYPIPANDDAMKSLDLILSTLINAVKLGRKAFKPLSEEINHNQTESKPVESKPKTSLKTKIVKGSLGNKNNKLIVTKAKPRKQTK